MGNEFEKAEQLNRARLENPSAERDVSPPKEKSMSRDTFIFLLILAIIGDLGDLANFMGYGIIVSFVIDIIIGATMLLTVGFASPKNMGKNLAKTAGTIFADFIPFIDFLPFRTLGVIWIYKSK